MPRVSIQRTAKQIVAEACDPPEAPSVNSSPGPAVAFGCSWLAFVYGFGIMMGFVWVWSGPSWPIAAPLFPNLASSASISFSASWSTSVSAILWPFSFAWGMFTSFCSALPFGPWGLTVSQGVARPPAYWEFLGPPPAHFNETSTFELSCQMPSLWEKSGIPSSKPWTQLVLTSFGTSSWTRRDQAALFLTPMHIKMSTDANYPVAYLEVQNHSGQLANLYLKHSSGATWSLEQVWNAQRCQVEIPYLPDGPFLLQASYVDTNTVIWSNVIEVHVETVWSIPRLTASTASSAVMVM